MSLELEIQKIIEQQFEALNRPDLVCTPLVAVSSAQNPRFGELNRNPARQAEKGASSTAEVCGKCLSACPLVYIP